MTRRMKALVTSSYPAPYRVGVFQELSKYFDLDVFFDTSQNENRNAQWFCKSGVFSFEILNNRESWRHFKEKLKRIRQYDFILAYDYTRRPSRHAIMQCRLHGVPFFLNCDGSIPHRGWFRNLVKWLVYPFIFKGAAACFASGQSAVQNYLKYGARREKIFIHHFTSLTEQDILSEPIAEEEKRKLKTSLGLEDKPLVLAIGQFIPRKGFDILLKAWKAVSCEAVLLLIGGGDDRPLYERIIHESQLDKVIIRDYMPKREVYKYYQAADLFVLPTREDIWGLVVNEAMAQGLPIVTTDKCVAGVELVENGLNGYVVKTGSECELAEKINALLEHPEDMATIAKNNLSKMKGWTMANVALNHVEVIKKTLNEG